VLARLYGRPVLMCAALGLLTALILFALMFYLYIALKSVFAAGPGVYVTYALLYGGMSKIEA
jgi:hypothetical protein